MTNSLGLLAKRILCIMFSFATIGAFIGYLQCLNRHNNGTLTGQILAGTTLGLLIGYVICVLMGMIYELTHNKQGE